MKVGEFEVSAEIERAAYGFMRSRSFRSSELEGVIAKMLPAESLQFDKREVAMRAADRLVQRERKRGALVFSHKVAGTIYWKLETA